MLLVPFVWPSIPLPFVAAADEVAVWFPTMEMDKGSADAVWCWDTVAVTTPPAVGWAPNKDGLNWGCG